MKLYQAPIIPNSSSQNPYLQFQNPNSYLLLPLYQPEHENEINSYSRLITRVEIENTEEQLLEQRVKEIETKIRHLGATQKEV